MGKTNGRQRRKNIERLADALQDCFDEAVNVAAERAANVAADRFDAKWRPLVDKQNETLRMIWRQCGGRPEQRLPIDD